MAIVNLVRPPLWLA